MPDALAREDRDNAPRNLPVTTLAGVILFLLGAAFPFLPEKWQGPGFGLFWGCSLCLVLAFRTFLRRSEERADNVVRVLAMSRDLFWTQNNRSGQATLSGAVTPITGRTPRILSQISLAELLEPNKAKAFEDYLKQGGPFSMEAGIRQPEGWFLPVEIKGAPGPGGGFEGVVRDLRDQKQWEKRLRDMEKEAERSEKMKNLGILAGSVAHDLNNILSGIATYPEVLLMDPNLDEKTRQGILLIKDSGRKASSVVSDLLTISRGGRADRQVLSLNAVIQRYMASAEFQKTIQTFPGVDIEVNLEPELLNMQGAYIHVEKAVMNLMINAVEETADKSGGQVSITTANFYADEGQTLAPGEYVVLSVADNGSGIPEDCRDKIFDPFFTQKEMGRSGTGLGLTVVRNTVQEHKGDIRVVSSGQGTRFDLFFPAIREEIPKSEEKNDLEEIKGHGETILIVDDIASQRKIGATILSNLGYEVFTVAGGEEAVAFVRERPVDLLVLDMVMAPGISGLETFRQIRKIRPGQKAIIASGHSESEDVIKTQEMGAGSFVRKPYTVMDMGIAVKEELEK